MIHVFGNKNSLFDQYVTELRDVDIQQDRLRFRKNLERIGSLFGYEISRALEYENREVTTSLGSTVIPVLKEHPVLIAIMRAGLPVYQGLLHVFDHSESGFVSSYRKYGKDNEFTIQVEYVSCPNIEGRTILLIDAMMATGESMVKALKELLTKGKPSKIHLVSVLVSEEAVENIKKRFSNYKVDIWTAAIDDEITARALLVPGLGDAGDLAFGSKE